MNTTPPHQPPPVAPTDTADSANDGNPAEASARRAERALAAIRILIDRFAQTPGADIEDQIGIDDFAEAVACLLHLAEACSHRLPLVIITAIRSHARQRDAEIEFIENVGVRLNRCRYCGEDVDETIRWFEPCARCRYSNGIYPERDRMPDGAAEQNLARAGWAEAAAQTYAALTRWDGADFCSADEEGHAEILSDLFGDLRHLAHRCGLDPEEVNDRGRYHYEEERAEEEDESAESEDH